MRYYKQFLLTLSLCFNLSIAHASTRDRIYNMADLEVLAAEKNFYEFFNHALDVVPSERKESYKNLMDEMGVAYLSYLAGRFSIEEQERKLLLKISKWPIFMGNEFFIKKRDFLFIKEIKHCFEAKNKQCVTLAEQLFNDYEHDAIFSFDIVNTLYTYKVPQQQLWSFAIPLVSKPISEFYCSKEPFKNIILNRLYQEMDSKQELSTQVHPDCLKQFQSDFRVALKASDNRNRIAAYLLLKQAKLAKDHDISTYHFFSFTNNPDLKGQLLDDTLKQLKGLSLKYEQRDELLKTLSKLDFLPGRFFESPESSKSQSRVSILNRYFPEYIDFYAKTCLQYLNETKVFPRGNPTTNCHELFKMNQKIKILPEAYVKQYNKATYFLKK